MGKDDVSRTKREGEETGVGLVEVTGEEEIDPCFFESRQEKSVAFQEGSFLPGRGQERMVDHDRPERGAARESRGQGEALRHAH